jgi:hypothetical protein
VASIAALVLITLAASAATRIARADRPALDCPSSSEEGQRLRDKNRYLEARAMFRTCSQSTCPGIVRKDCSKWLAELDETQPSVVIAAQDAAGADLATVKVLVDDKPIATRIDGSPITVDPGEHTLRVEAPGHAPLTQRLIVRVNEKNRLVRVVFQDRSANGASGPPKPPAETTETKSGPPLLGFVLTGVGALALGSFAYFGLTSKNDLQSLRSSCAPYCDQSKLDDVKSRMLVADVSLGVGIVALGLAVVAFATHGSSSHATTTARR